MLLVLKRKKKKQEKDLLVIRKSIPGGFSEESVVSHLPEPAARAVVDSATPGPPPRSHDAAQTPLLSCRVEDDKRPPSPSARHHSTALPLPFPPLPWPRPSRARRRIAVARDHPEQIQARHRLRLVFLLLFVHGIEPGHRRCGDPRRLLQLRPTDLRGTSPSTPASSVTAASIHASRVSTRISWARSLSSLGFVAVAPP